MKLAIVLLALLLGGIVMPTDGPATAADLGLSRAPAYGHGYALPFPRSARAAVRVGRGHLLARLPGDLHLGADGLPRRR